MLHVNKISTDSALHINLNVTSKVLRAGLNKSALKKRVNKPGTCSLMIP